MVVEVFAAFDQVVLLAKSGRFVEGKRHGATCDTWLTYNSKKYVYVYFKVSR
jgi:hypothetical protein